MNPNIRQEVLELMKSKDRIENEIKELSSILTQNGVGMHEPLVDPEGFPLNNIDIYQVRTARQKIICLQNDHKALMKKIENGIHDYYSTTRDSSPNQNVQPMEMSEENSAPFAKITVVSPGSPAELAGLRENDALVRFGSIDASNFRTVNDIGSVVQYSEGQRINVKIERDGNNIACYLIPKRWSGKGLLGCNVVPL